MIWRLEDGHKRKKEVSANRRRRGHLLHSELTNPWKLAEACFMCLMFSSFLTRACWKSSSLSLTLARRMSSTTFVKTSKIFRFTLTFAGAWVKRIPDHANERKKYSRRDEQTPLSRLLHNTFIPHSLDFGLPVAKVLKICYFQSTHKG